VRIIFFGTPQFAVPTLDALIESPHELIAVVTQADKRRGRREPASPSPVKKVGITAGVSVLQPLKLRDVDFINHVASLKPDLGVVAAYGKFLPDNLLAIPRLGMFNVHASLLPRYRGAAPIHRAVIAGETETGVTIIRLVAEMDAGPMLCKAKVSIGPNDTSASLEDRLAELGAVTLLKTLNQIDQGTAVETEQDHTLATLAPLLNKDDGRIDWNLSAQNIHNLVRGLHPWPHACTYLDKQRLAILKTSLVHRLLDNDILQKPGNIIKSSGSVLTVVAGGRSLIDILELQPEGKRALKAKDFLNGYKINDTSRFINFS
tara:strand:- start:7167 stop:8120 length:954 start_codon:yes stop_codon:yes gene_type:complete